ncbi:MAG: hypothetical protein IIZ39_01395 [Blautia sp.]|nr:hypothetical protein [Blautia sp.]
MIPKEACILSVENKKAIETVAIEVIEGIEAIEAIEAGLEEGELSSALFLFFS